MSSDLQGLRNLYWRIKTTRAEVLEAARIEADARVEEMRREFAERAGRLIRNGVARKSEIARTVGFARATLDGLLKEYEQTSRFKPYTFEVGYGKNVTLVGLLPDYGGFPRLEGEQKIRFRIHDGIATADDFHGAEEAFLNATYGAEAHEFAVAEKVPGYDQPFAVGDNGGDW